MRWPPASRRGADPAERTDRLWQRTRHAARRAALWGGALGVLLGLLLFAPASWLASALYGASGERLLLADAQGSIWSGHAVLVLAGGPGSRDASALPGRLHWRLRPSWRGGLKMRARQDCCLLGELRLELRPGWSGYTLLVPARPDGLGRWPAQWLAGLGTPWNTLQLGGTLQLASSGLDVQVVQGRTRLAGGLDLQLLGASSRLAPLDELGSYRIQLRGQEATGDAALTLDTLGGALRLSGTGQWTGAKLHFRGEAQAAPGQEAALANLLNIIGPRRGALAVISIG